MSTSNYRLEFPDFPVTDLPTLPSGFVDQSWHNDVCPSFVNEQLGLSLFIEYADVHAREFSGGKRFTLYTPADHGDPILETDDWQAVLDAIAFTKWQASRIWCADFATAGLAHADYHEAERGYAYAAGCWIADLRPLPGSGHVRYWTVADRGDVTSDDLAEVERFLWDNHAKYEVAA